MNERLAQTPDPHEQPDTPEIAKGETDLNALAEELRAGTHVPDKDKVEAFMTGDRVIPTAEQTAELARIRAAVKRVIGNNPQGL